MIQTGFGANVFNLQALILLEIFQNLMEPSFKKYFEFYIHMILFAYKKDTQCIGPAVAGYHSPCPGN